MAERLEIALEEYRQLWSYHHKTMDQRRFIFAFVVSILTFARGAVVALSRDVLGPLGDGDRPSPHLPYLHDLFSPVMVGLGLMGLFANLAYIVETVRAREARDALEDLRGAFRTLESVPDEAIDLKEALTFDEGRGPSTRAYWVWSTAFLRGMILVLLNSMLFTLAIVPHLASFASLLVSPLCIAVLFIVATYCQVVLGQIYYWQTYSGPRTGASAKPGSSA